jgi:benzoyl-CoA reductase subunit B
MSEQKLYPTEPLKCWNKAKELRYKYYKDYVEAKEKGGIRWSGSAFALYSIVSGLGDDVYSVTGEPYGATTAFFSDFSIQCLEAAERAGIARDLCASLRNYWGMIILDKFILPDGTILNEWPKADFLFTCHMCCGHAKWYQRAGELEGGVPLYAIDTSVGPYPDIENKEAATEYVIGQMLDAIDWMEKVTGRKYNDELLIEAINNECRSLSLWAEICTYNENIPAPLDEKSMFSLYVQALLNPQCKETADFYRELRDEVKDRAERGIAAVPNERFRLTTDGQPPWAALKVFRYLEKEYGAVSIGSWYSFCLMGAWDEEADGTLVPLKTPEERGLKLSNREEALKAYADFKMRSHSWHMIQSLNTRIRMLSQVVDQWKVNAVFSHFNKGCEVSSLGILEGRLVMLEKNIPVMSFEGNMGDSRDFDLARTMARIDSFMEGLELKKLTK